MIEYYSFFSRLNDSSGVIAQKKYDYFFSRPLKIGEEKTGGIIGNE
jgi:hypothetical protein